MDRYTAIDKEYITYREAKDKGWNEYACREEELKRRLKLYEDTGLEPEEVTRQVEALRLIDADKLIAKLEEHAKGCQYDSNRANNKAEKDMYLNRHTGFMQAICIVMNMPLAEKE